MKQKKEIVLDTKVINDIKGVFRVPSYQRGYRWNKVDVKRLLDDIYDNGENNYCMQPIVVLKKDNNEYELIDGQQRLTTIFLIYKYMHNKSEDIFPEPNFTILYSTRKKNEEFIKKIDLELRDDNIDYWFMCQAYETIAEWFQEKGGVHPYRDISAYLEKNVKVIWYEVENQEKNAANELFTRLNIGRIPLTNAELVKSMFLNKNNKGMTLERQEEIALQWDNMEKELHDESLWSFLTNEIDSEKYQTRIDLVLDLIAKKPLESKEKYYTFFAIDDLAKKEGDHIEIWNRIQKTFLLLKNWYENHTFYHKIGYLITSESKSLQDIYSLYEGKTKTEFSDLLDIAIKESIKSDVNYAELEYGKHKDKISRLLFLFNVESVRKIDNEARRFPFDEYKKVEKGQSWSLEHIHAQQSEGIKKNVNLWIEWLKLHKDSVKVVCGECAVLDKMNEAIEKESISEQEFNSIFEEVTTLLSTEGSVEYTHSISNLALLKTSNNSVLGNSAFDVKRNEIIRMDKKGQFIPFCTKMVFLKYYTDSDDNQIHFWGPADRIAYVNGMNEVLSPYLSEKISVENMEVD